MTIILRYGTRVHAERIRFEGEMLVYYTNAEVLASMRVIPLTEVAEILPDDVA